MSALHETRASLRFFGEDLDPDAVTALLGQEPTHACRKGDVRRRPDGREWRERQGAWRRVIERRTPGDLDAQLRELLVSLTPDLTVWKTLSGRFQADVFCGLFMQGRNEGLTLKPETLLALGARGLSIGLDIYGPDTDEAV